MEKKYKLTDESVIVNGKTLHRIEALRDFGDVEKGDKGGFIENESNLSQSDDCWVFGDAVVYGYVMVFGDAMVYDNAEICGDTLVCEDALVYGDAEVYGNAEVYGYAQVFGNAEICGDAVITNKSDYILFKNWWSSGRHFTWTKSNNMWKVGCFYGTGKELIDKAYKDSEKSGREYEKIVKYVESILEDNNADV